MNNQFDELTKEMAQSVSRRAALRKFGVGLAGMALACFGLENSAAAARGDRITCRHNCLDYYLSAGYSQKEASAFCDSQCAWICVKRPI